jgi:hypothetical protein
METEQKSVDYQAVLDDLEAKRQSLDNAIAGIKYLLGHAVGVPATGQHKPQAGNALTPTSFFGMSVGDAAKQYLAAVKVPKSTPDIAKALKDHGITTVSENFAVTVFTALQRKEGAGEIVRPKRGLWGLKEWYPGHRPSNKSKDEKPESPKAKKNEPPPLTGEPLKAHQVFGITAFENFVREKPRRMKEVLLQFNVAESTVKKAMEPASKVYRAGIGWLKVRS